MTDLIERLRRTELRYTGASNIFTGDEHVDLKPETVLVNPDGPEAASELQSQSDRIADTHGFWLRWKAGELTAEEAMDAIFDAVVCPPLTKEGQASG